MVTKRISDNSKTERRTKSRAKKSNARMPPVRFLYASKSESRKSACSFGELAEMELQRLLEPHYRKAKKRANPNPRELVLRMQLVPTPLHGRSLSNSKTIPERWWTNVRSENIQWRGQVCEICHTHVTEPRDLIAHEQWSYEVRGTSGLATLSGIQLQCRRCDSIVHFGFTRVMMHDGRLTPYQVHAVIEHFLAVNGVDLDTFNAHESAARIEHRERSEIKEWEIHYGLFQDLVDSAVAMRARRKAKALANAAN